MNKKRIAALMTAAATLLAATPVMASDYSQASGSATVSGSGSVTAYDQTPVYKVTLPTSNSLDFTADPYGLLEKIGTSTSTSVSVDALSDTGSITAASGSGALILNRSSEDITVSVKMTPNVISGNATFMKTASEVASGSSTGNNIFLAIIPSESQALTVTSYSAAQYAIPVVSGSTTEDAKFRLNKAAYEIVYDSTSSKYKLQAVTDSATTTGVNADGTVFKMGGYINPNADWNDFASSNGSSMYVDFVFSFEPSKDEEYDKVYNVYGLVSGSAANITNDTSGSASGGITLTNATASSKSGIDFTANYDRTAALTLTLSGTNLTIQGVQQGASTDSLSVNASVSSTTSTVTIAKNFWGGASVGDKRYLKITLSDSSTLTVELTITK